MPKKILLIENDSAFAGAIAGALESVGFETRTAGDGNEGLDLAREWSPDAIVLCVEMPGVSGYLVCQKLKKSDQLKSIPLVLTSAEATEETFEKHRTLKARADEYLLKPYEPATLVDKLAALVGLPEGSGAGAEDHEEELVSLEEEIGLEAAEGGPDAEIPGLDLQSLPDEPSPGARADDDDFKLLDEAFDGLAAPPAPKGASAPLDLDLAMEKPVRGDDVDAAAASLPEDDEDAARADLGGLGDEADRALGALGGADESLSPSPPESEPTTRPVRGANADVLRAAGIKLLDDDPGAAAPDADAISERSPAEPDLDLPRPGRNVAADDEELGELRRKNADLARRAEEAESEAEKARTEARRAEADLDASRDEARRASEQARDAEAEIAELRRKVADAEDGHRRTETQAETAASARIEALERELDELRTELLVARGEADGARGEVEKRTADLRSRLAEVEAESAKNEERIVKAYQKIKADERIRDKVRKALAIAAQLLEEGPAPDAGAEKDSRAATAIGRE
jgi:CheY-like chemotaxis protein